MMLSNSSHADLVGHFDDLNFVSKPSAIAFIVFPLLPESEEKYFITENDKRKMTENE